VIPYGRQSIDSTDVQAVSAALMSEFLTTGPLVKKFEDEIAEVVGAPAFCVSSGTAALHSAFAAIEISPGDEIITPPITFIATQATAALFGAKIVFADVLPQNATIDPEYVKSLISERTKAIVAVDYAGHPAALHELSQIARKNGVYLIEDAAHSIGSYYRGIPVGSIADLTTFSFFPTKNLTTGEGGAVSSNNSDLLEKARRFSRQGLVREPSGFLITGEGAWHQEVHSFGLNYRLPDVLCALGISQISKLNEFKEAKKKVFSIYTENLSSVEQIKLPTAAVDVDVNWHLFPIRVDAATRLDFYNHLRANGVYVQVNYLPAYRHPVFSSYEIDRKLYPVSEKFYSEEISLPMFSDLSFEAQTYVIKIIKEYFN
jgi:dTDP-4-amino-4,6-dideoxygalactose transaminase